MSAPETTRDDAFNRGQRDMQHRAATAALRHGNPQNEAERKVLVRAVEAIMGLAETADPIREPVHG